MPNRKSGGCPASSAAWALSNDLVLRGLDELDLLAGLLLEGGDDLRDRLVLLGVEALLPPDHEVGGPGAERRQDDRYGKNDGASAHRGASPMGITDNRGAFLAAATGATPAASAAGALANGADRRPAALSGQHCQPERPPAWLTPSARA